MGKESRQARHARVMKPVTLHVATRAALDELIARHRGDKSRLLGQALLIVEKQTREVTHGAANALAKYLEIHLADVYTALYDFQMAGAARKKKLLDGTTRVEVMRVPKRKTAAKKTAAKKTAAKKKTPKR